MATDDDRSHLDTAVDLNADGPVTITFDALSYSVPVPVHKRSAWEKFKGISLDGIPKDEVFDKYLLTNVTGTIKPNTMTALMGPSGAGKSTLLDVLSKRKSTGTIEGELLINGKEPNASYKRVIGYVEQRDTLIATLTPRELFYYSALIRLPSSVSAAYIDARVKQVISELGLETCADTMIGNEVHRGISGGQAKRVNIGIELLTDPRVLFLDEPTTGLDSTTALEVMTVMRDITNRGRTTICTIHQPSSDVFKLFDKLLLLVDGNVVYLGDASKAVGHFENMGFVRPKIMNPADFLIAVTGGGTGQGEKMVEGPDVNKNYFIEQYLKSELASDRSQSTAAHKAHFMELRRTKQILDGEQPQFLNPRMWAFYVLLRRQFAMRKRDTSYWLSRFAQVTIMLFLVCTVFHSQVASDPSAVLNIVSVINFGAMTFGFGSLGQIPGLLHQRLFFTRERNASAYQVLPYFCAVILAELPVEMAKGLLWTITVYPSVGLRANVAAGIIYYCILLLTDLVGFGMASTFAFLAPDHEAASAMMFPVLITSFLFAGFYIQKPSIPDYWIWMYYLSWLNYSFNSQAMNQWPPGQTDGFMLCQGSACSVATNDQVLAAWGFGPASGLNYLWANMVVLVGLMVAWFTLSYLALRFRKHGSR
eukprot:comp23138_c0_seq1/m.37347 comp23138_c0_seq1/g.37347  ORF comp23138_c0_seq1/g.37347 comp23138_c0_seq1/m.37347 type:complete len:649 (-) comp23138_c0_seq1:240-2186(-)